MRGNVLTLQVFTLLRELTATDYPIHRGPLFREIQYIANRPTSKKKKKIKNIKCLLFYLISEKKKCVPPPVIDFLRLS